MSSRRNRPRAGPRMGLLAVGLSTLVIAGGGQAVDGANAMRRPPTGERGARTATAGRFAVGMQVMRLVDSSRVIRLARHRTRPRVLVTDVRYPALPANASGSAGAPASAQGPFPLVIFAHGYDVTPRVYSALLDRWASAGYVVAAPTFPLTNPHAPGGPREGDIVNEPSDVSFLITRLLAASASGTGPLAGLIDPAHIAVAGHSDGAEVALGCAYEPGYRDARVHAAVILSGAPFSGPPTAMPPGGPPLLATLGTRDTTNPPHFSRAVFRQAARPKFLLELRGAGHLAPYSYGQPWLEVVEAVSTAFLDRYLKGASDAARRMRSAGDVPDVSLLVSRP